MSDEQRWLVRGFVAEQCVGRGMIAGVACHDIRLPGMTRHTDALTEITQIHRAERPGFGN